MSHTKVKTTYQVEGPYGSSEERVLYCHHNHTCDYMTFYDSDGQVQEMFFQEWSEGNDLWDAMIRLWSPFDGDWGQKLREGVEYYEGEPWKNEKRI